MIETTRVALLSWFGRTGFSSFSRSGFALALALLLLPAFAAAQAPAKRAPAAEAKVDKVRVNVGVSTAKPEDVIDIPVTMALPEGVKVTKIEAVVTFPKKILSLERSELGLAGEQSEAEVKVDTKDDKDADLSDAVVTITSKSMKPGILAYMKFKVAETATKGSISLKILESKATSDSGQSLEMAQGKDGEVSIFNKDEEIPVVGCFFFSH